MIEIDGPKLSFFGAVDDDGNKVQVLYQTIKMRGKNPHRLAVAMDERINFIKKELSETPNAVILWRKRPEITAVFNDDTPTGDFDITCRLATFPFVTINYHKE
jgi:hypothetical protein